jgi:hypothetical protein
MAALVKLQFNPCQCAKYCVHNSLSRVACEGDGDLNVFLLALCHKVVEPNGLEDRHTHVVRVGSLGATRPGQMFGSEAGGRQGEALPRKNLLNSECTSGGRDVVQRCTWREFASPKMSKFGMRGWVGVAPEGDDWDAHKE